MSAPPRATPNRTPIVIGAVVLVVALLAAIVAIASAGGDDDDGVGPAATAGAGAESSASSAPVPGAVDQYPAVEVAGTPLDPYDAESADPAVGQVPPTLTGSTYAGEPITIDPADGPMLVVFLAHWCPHCNAEVPRLLDWRESGDVPDELQILGVSTGARDDAPNWPPSEWLADVGWDFPTLGDDTEASALAAWGGTAFPYFVLVGTDGTVAARATGEVPIADLDALVDTVLGA